MHLRILPPPAVAVLLALGAPDDAHAQRSTPAPLGAPARHGAAASAAANAAPAPFTVLPDAPARRRVAESARRATGSRLVISLEERRLWWMQGPRVLRTAPVAIGKGTRLEYRKRTWDFTTPHGVRTVQRKERNPVWVPPDWHYVELARDSSYTLVYLEAGKSVRLRDGSALEVRGGRIVQVRPGGKVEVIPGDEEVIFGRTLYIPPYGTANRLIRGELGAYKLEIGDGYLLHGTPHTDSIGRAATHGCLRLRDADIEYLYRNVPLGTAVYLF